MKKILIYHNFSENDIGYLKSKFDDYDFVVSTIKNEMEKHIVDADALIAFRCTKEMIEKAKNIKWVQALTAGVDAFPVDEIKSKGIVLTNGKGIHKIHMAEYAIGAMIFLSRNFHILIKNQYKGIWDRNVFQSGIDGKTLGILGLGSIGKEIARRAKFMGMKVIGIKGSVSEIENVDKVYPPENMMEVFKASDYLINLLPSTPETLRIINKECFNNIKDEACFINIGRGKTVDENHMIKALEEGKIRAAFLDVFFTEPLPKDSPLWKMENVVITPHICGESSRYIERALPIIENNLRAFKGEGIYINQFNFDKGY